MISWHTHTELCHNDSLRDSDVTHVTNDSDVTNDDDSESWGGDQAHDVWV